MDLISREKLLKKIEHNERPIYTEYEMLEWCMECIKNEKTVLKLTAGEWISDDGFPEDVYICSECREPFILMEGTPKDNQYNFCPKCGARLYYSGGET